MDILNGKDDIRTLLIGSGLTTEEANEIVREADMAMTATEIAKQIAKDRGISLGQAYRHVARGRTEDPAPEGWSHKDYILEALYRMNANAGVSAPGLHSRLKSMGVKTNLNEVNALVWDLQKQGLVKFSESHTGSGSALSKIRLTPEGRAKIVDKRGTPQQAVLRVNADAIKERGLSSQSRRGAVHQAGIDKTYYRNHRRVAEGGPVEIVVPGRKPEIVPEVPYTPPTKRTPEPLPQNMKAPLIGETSEPPMLAEVSPIPAEVTGMDVAPDTHTQYRVPDMQSYPVLMHLVARREEKAKARVQAAKYVEAASLISDLDPDEAETLMTKAADLEGPSLTKLELEVLRFIDEVTGE